MSSWLPAAMRASRVMGSSSDNFGFSPHILDESDDIINDPRFQNILAGARFTQYFILTYHAAIFGILLAFTIGHWTERLYYSRGSSRSRKTSIDEDTPLIGAHTTKWANHESSRPGWIPRIRGLLMYQPRSIPFFNKTLPSNGTSLALLAFIGLNVFYLFFNCPLKLEMAFVFGDRAAALFVANLPLLYLFAAKNQPIKSLTGRSYEALNIIHRRLGEWLCLLAVVHFISMVLVWYTILEPLGWSFAFYLSRKIVILGILAFVSYEVLYFTSLGSFRERWYELFLVSHIVLQLAALIFVFFHHPKSRIPVLATLAIYFVDRVMFRFWLTIHWTTATLTVLDDNESLKISAKWPLPSLPRSKLLRTHVKYGWRATEHVFITIPALSRRHQLQAHPFTIMSSPPQSPTTFFNETAELDLLVRAQDGFSRDALNFAHRNPGIAVRVRLDGAYGSKTAVENLARKDRAVFFAGGSGIAAILPLIRELLSRGRPRGTVYLVWICRYESQRSWLGASEYTLLREVGVEIIQPPCTSTHGRPALDRYLEDCLDQYEVRTGSIGVVTSGPDAMNRQVRNACSSLVSKHALDIDVFVEKFGW